METDIHFGELEESNPDTSLRPDRNKQYAVAAIDSPQDEDLPVFVDLDVILDMEEHALDDTTVELGGVMLGGHFHDQDGKPFVLISDSLRAKHYESTKGSFKFTHDTWSEITREREEFPDDLQMVGWYHTHPDWGVFLSGMDMFICDNFFNKILDVALVIDPCRDDRGMFQWTGDPANRIRRTGGFYLISSRFRREELEEAAEQLSGGGGEMAITRMRSTGGGNPTVVQVPERNSWQGTAVMGMMTMQFLLVLLVAVKLLFPNVQLGNEKMAELESQVARLSIAETNRIRSDAQDELLDDMLKRMGQGSNAFSKAVDAKEAAAQWKAASLGQSYHVKELERHLQLEKSDKKKSIANYDKITKENKLLRDQRKKYRDERDALRKKLGLPVAEDAGDETKLFFGVAWWWWPIWGAILVALVGGAVLTSMNAQKEEDPRYRRDDPTDEVNFEESDDGRYVSDDADRDAGADDQDEEIVS